VQQGMVRPGDAGARQKQDDGVVERQVPGIDDLDALWRPLTAGIFEAGRLNGLVRIKAGIEIGPEPRDEEHHLRGDEHDHAVTQVKRNDAGVATLIGFLDRVCPPCVHGVKHDDETDIKQPGIGQFHSEQLEGASRQVTHVTDAAEGQNEGADRGQKRPGAWIYDVVVVVLLMRICHV